MLGYFLFYIFIYLHQVHLNFILIVLKLILLSYIDLHHYSFILFIFNNLVIWVILNHYLLYITLRNLISISKIKIIQFFIYIKIILRCLTFYFNSEYWVLHCVSFFIFYNLAYRVILNHYFISNYLHYYSYFYNNFSSLFKN